MTRIKDKRMTLQEAQVHAAYMELNEGWPRCYYWSAVWWRLHAKESAYPREPLQYSRNLQSLYRDIKNRPEYYHSDKRPAGISDYLWRQLDTARP